MKLFILLLIFALAYVPVKSDLNDCLAMCEVGSINLHQHWSCKRECYREATQGGYKTDNYGECIQHCRRRVKRERLRECETACSFYFNYNIESMNIIRQAPQQGQQAA